MLQTFTLGSFAQGAAGGAGSFESIATANGTGSSGTINFTSIPNTYQHLQIRVIARDDTAGTAGQGLALRLGTPSIDTGTNYARHYLYGNGSSVSAVGTASTSTIQLVEPVAGGGSTANIHGVAIIDIHDYASTTKNKTVRAFTGVDFNNANGTLALNSGLWMNTGAIQSIRLYIASGNFTTSSTFALYGIKGA